MSDLETLKTAAEYQPDAMSETRDDGGPVKWGMTVDETISKLEDLMVDPDISHVHSGVFLAAAAHLKDLLAARKAGGR